MGKRIGIAVIGLLVIAGGVWVISRFWPAEAAVEAQPAAAQVVADAGRVGAEGQLLPAAHARLGVPAGGRIATLLVAAGDRVAGGDPLLRLEATGLEASADQAQAAADQAQAALDGARAGLDLAIARRSSGSAGRDAAEAARSAADANLALVDDDPPDDPLLAASNRAAAEAGVAEASAAVAQAESALRQADAAVAQAEAGVAQAEAALVQTAAAQQAAAFALEQATLRAPFAGTVVAVDARVGEIAPPGAALITLANIGSWLVETSDLIELDVAAVSLGAPAVITVDALPAVRLPATVTAIAQTPTLVRGDTTYVVTLELETPADLPLRWGMTTFVDIEATP